MLFRYEKLDKDQLNKNVEVLDKIYTDFLIIDDNTNFHEIEEVMVTIRENNYTPNIVSFSNICENLKDRFIEVMEKNKIDMLVGVGDGGSRVLDQFLKQNKIDEKIKIVNVIWSRNWDNGKFINFAGNIKEFDFKDKNIVLIEDVIATGDTLWNIYRNINELGGNVLYIISLLISGESPLIEKSFINSIVGVKVLNDGKIRDISSDPYWYPAIYSLRHLIYGDKEDKKFFLTLKEKYFQNREVEKKIKLLRGGYR